MQMWPQGVQQGFAAAGFLQQKQVAILLCDVSGGGACNSGGSSSKRQ
jgi:hypothetical protein